MSGIETPIEYARNRNFRDRYLCHYDERQDCQRWREMSMPVYEIHVPSGTAGAPINKFHGP